MTRKCTRRTTGTVLEPCWNLSLLGCKAGLILLLFYFFFFFFFFLFLFPTSLCGVLVFDSVSRVLLQPPTSRLPPPPPHITTQSFITHPLSHTLFDTQSFTHTIFHTPSLTSSFTYHLSHTIFYTHHLSLTIFVTHLCQSLSHTHTSLSTTIAWQAWHLATCAFISRGRRGTWRHVPSFHVAGVALMALGWLWWRALLHTTSFTHHPSLSISHTHLCQPQLPPHLCVGFLFLILYPGLSSSSLPPPASAASSHNTIFHHTPSFTHPL